MGMNETPAANRVHIAFFGRRNAGKSSVVNAVTGQNIAIVSDTPGTTTDPVYKAMELLPIGPVMIVDTPGIDDIGELGELRVKKAYRVLDKTDIAVLIVDGAVGLTEQDNSLLDKFREKNIPYIVVYNKSDLRVESLGIRENEISVSAATGENIFELKELIAKIASSEQPKPPLIADLLETNDIVLLVIPIDKAAPKGRLILPQQQTIRDILEAGAISIVAKETELQTALKSLAKKPKIVITDSQVFGKVSNDVPKDILLTSFSILFARHKGNLALAVKGVTAINSLQDGETVLISEGCTHHRQCDDIGTVKIPKWISEYTKKRLNFAFTSGTEFPEDLSGYKLIVHCGGCMINEREMKYRMQCAIDQHIPMTNYGILIAYINGILRRSVEAFSDVAKLLD